MKKYIAAEDAINAIIDGVCSGWDCEVVDKVKSLPAALVLDQEAIELLKSKIKENAEKLWEWEGSGDYCDLLDELIDYIDGLIRKDIEKMKLIDADATLQNMQTIEAEPVKHGWWIEEGFSIRCSECDGVWDNIWDFIYCPNCGAKMDLQGPK